jgi:hypothetical protein
MIPLALAWRASEDAAVCHVQTDFVQGFAVSPDGRRLAIIGSTRPADPPAEKIQHRTIMTVAAGGGEPKEIFRPKNPE